MKRVGDLIWTENSSRGELGRLGSVKGRAERAKKITKADHPVKRILVYLVLRAVKI